MDSSFERLSPGHYLGLIVHSGYECGVSIERDMRIAELNIKNVRGIASAELKFEGESVLKILGERKRIKRGGRSHSKILVWVLAPCCQPAALRCQQNHFEPMQ